MLGVSILLIVGAGLAWLWIERERREISKRMDEMERRDDDV